MCNTLPFVTYLVVENLDFREEVMDGSVSVLQNEKVLVARAMTEPGAFAVIYDYYFPRIYNYVHYRVANQETADDITSQIFEKALLRLNQFDPKRGYLVNWLFGIARYTIRDHLRALKRHRWLSLDALAFHQSTGLLPEERVVRDDLHSQVLKAVSELGDREKDLIALKFGGKLTNRQIADLTGLSENNVGVILFRAIGKLRMELTER